MLMQTDVAIIGGGPAGSCLASFLVDAGYRVLIVEKEEFPRFHIGESLTGIAGAVLDELGLTQKLDEYQFPPKGGVKVIGRNADTEFFVPVLIPTHQVRRAEFDHMLLDRATCGGAQLIHGEAVSVIREGDKVSGFHFRKNGSDELTEVRCRFVVDASGQCIVFSKLGVAGKRRINPMFDRQVAVFTHIEGALRDPGQMGNNTFLFYDKLHHWAWFIPVSSTVTSVGIVIPNEIFREHGDKERTFAWGIEHLNPDLWYRVKDKQFVEPVRAAVNYSYDIEPFAGDGWLCVGDAHGFIDPIFSFGVAIGLQEAREASKRIDAILKGADWQEQTAAYVRYCRRGLSVAADVIQYFWQFPVFFGYLMRGAMRRDLIRLLGSDIHTEAPLPAIELMRKTLARTRAENAMHASSH